MTHRRRVLLTIVGVLLLVIGVIELLIPGPGLLFIFAGMMVLSTVSRRMRRIVAKLRRRFPRLFRAHRHTRHRLRAAARAWHGQRGLRARCRAFRQELRRRPAPAEKKKPDDGGETDKEAGEDKLCDTGSRGKTG